MRRGKEQNYLDASKKRIFNPFERWLQKYIFCSLISNSFCSAVIRNKSTIIGARHRFRVFLFFSIFSSFCSSKFQTMELCWTHCERACTIFLLFNDLSVVCFKSKLFSKHENIFIHIKWKYIIRSILFTRNVNNCSNWMSTAKIPSTVLYNNSNSVD